MYDTRIDPVYLHAKINIIHAIDNTLKRERKREIYFIEFFVSRRNIRILAKIFSFLQKSKSQRKNRRFPFSLSDNDLDGYGNAISYAFQFFTELRINEHPSQRWPRVLIILTAVYLDVAWCTTYYTRRTSMW